MEQHTATSPCESRQLRTLLVEPDPDTRQALELELTVRGQTVVQCADARGAWLAISERMFPLIIMNRNLPGVDTLRFCSEARALPEGHDTTILLLSTTPSDADRAAASAAGADAYLAWPAGSDTLREELDSAEHLARARTGKGRSVRPDEERFLVINPDGSIRQAAPVAERLLGFPPEALAGVNAFGFFHVDDAPQILSIVTEALVRPGTTRVIEARVRRDGDTWRTIAVSAVNLLTDPAIHGIAFDLRGPDARISIDDQVTRAAMHDHVTALPNRSLFIDRVDHAIARAGRRQQPVVVMAVDFNDFASSDRRSSADINDGLVIAVAQRLRSCLRASDTAARLGSDDFGLLLEDIADLSHVDIVANRIIKAMSVPFVNNGDEITFMPNIGIAVSSPERNRAADLLRDSGIAKAWALVQGSGRFVMFDPSMRPPDGEPVTDEFDTASQPHANGVATHLPGADSRLTDLTDRIATLEERLARIIDSSS